MSTATPANRPPGAPTAATLPVVLVVDDDREMRAYLRRCLQPLEHRFGAVLEAADGLAAFELAGRVQVDLVITDLVMPRLDGLGLARRLGRRALPPAVLLVSGQLGIERANMPGVGGWLEKPFDRQTLCHRVGLFLDSWEEPRDVREEQEE